MHMKSNKQLYLIILVFIIIGMISATSAIANHNAARARIRDLGIRIGSLAPGPLNAITDVSGVKVGHETLIQGEQIRTGVTAIIPHSDNVFQKKVPAAIYVFNGFGKLSGYTQVRELGNLETPIILTNTLSVGTAVNALIEYTLNQTGNETVRSVNAVVGETNDGYLNDIRLRAITKDHVFKALQRARSGLVTEGSVGAGTGTTALGFKGGIGTASRLTPPIGNNRYTVGVLVQSNFGRQLMIKGIPFPGENRTATDIPQKRGGSCMIVIATDAPLCARNLERLAKHAFNGMARTCQVMSNSSGDYAVAFSTAYQVPHQSVDQHIALPRLVANSAMTVLFQAVAEATQEAIYNSLTMATEITGFQHHSVPVLPLEQLSKVLSDHHLLHPADPRKQ